MRLGLAVSVLALSGAALIIESQWGAQGERLYLLSGTFGFQIQMPAKLYQVSDVLPDSPSVVARVADDIGCVLADYDRRRLVVGYPTEVPTEFSVINMDSPSLIRKMRIPYDSSTLLPGGDIFLLDLPNKGEVVALALHRLSGLSVFAPTHFTAAPLDGSGPVAELPLDDVKYIRVGGAVGGGLPGLQQIP